MSIEIDLPSELAKQFHEEAHHRKMSLSDYVLEILKESSVMTPKTGTELVSYWREGGVIKSRSDIPKSRDYARRLRARAEKRERSSQRAD
jgi:hypothetical protein